MQIRKISNIERRLTTSVRGFPLGGVLGLLLFTSQLGGLGCGGRTMLGSLPTVGTVGGSAGTSEQNTGGSGAGGAQAGGGLQPDGGSILGSGGLAAGGTPTGGVSMGGTVSGGASGSSGSGAHPLWRESSQPFCSDSTPWVGFLQVWSDGRARDQRRPEKLTQCRQRGSGGLERVATYFVGSPVAGFPIAHIKTTPQFQKMSLFYRL